jgi:phosphoserine phosphatase
LAVSAAVVLITRRGRTIGTLVDLGVSSIARDRVGGLTLSIGAGMTAFFTLAVVLWIALVAPAVYGSDRARDALVKSLEPKILRSEVFRSNLIVTGTLLSNTACSVRVRPYSAGPLYSCFEGPTRCIGSTSEQWELFRRPVPARALQAVFASGSPFPVFPAHKVALPNGCEVPLVDGGYAHNVPLEAAVASEARQVLVINASPEDEDTEGAAARVLSDLARGARRIFPFLFSRAQELDRSMARRLMVASLTPHPDDNRAWPSLLDFRQEQQDRVVDQANREIEERRRIGHIEAWGTPMVATIVRRPEHAMPSESAPRSALEGSRWLPHIRRQLDALLASGSGVAAFDLDDTTLAGDIGEALFLKIVAELHYAGDREEFWALIPNAGARDTLRAYWQRFQKEGADGKGSRIHYADPSTWPNGFADYIALFQRQYQDLVAQPDGARRAYPWLARLMTGMSEPTVRRLAWELWTSEMVRGDTAQEIRSAAHGNVRIEGGVRVHGEIADLMRRLEQRGWQVWIVTASNQFVAEEAAWHLGIPAARVLGIRPRIVDGMLSAELESPITYREGKQEALTQRGLQPSLVAGDSMTDFDMLRAARVALIVDRGRIERGLMTRPPVWLLQPFGTLTRRVVYE